MHVAPRRIVPTLLVTLSWLISPSAFAETIEVPPVTITEIGVESFTDMNETSINNVVTIPSGLGSYENDGFTAEIGKGDTIIVTVRPKEGTRFLVSKHPDPTSNTMLYFNLFWQAASGAAGNFSTPTITFDDLVGPTPTVDYTLAYLSDNGGRVGASMIAIVNGDVAFTSITFTFDVSQSHPATPASRTYASAGSSSSPSLGAAASSLNPEFDTSVPLFRMVPFASAASTLSTADHALLADGVTTTTVTLQARGVSGTEIPFGGETVTFETTLGSLGAVTDHGDGTYSATLTSATKAGTALISATVNGQTVTSPTSVAFEAGPAVATRSTLTANPTSTLANGTNVSVHVQLLDANGNPATSSGAEVALTTTHGAFQSIASQGDGAYKAILTAPASSTSSIATLQATLNGAPIGTPVDVTFQAWQPQALTVRRAPIGTANGEPWPVQPIVDLLDVEGEVVTLSSEAVTITLVSAADATLVGTTTVNAVDGRATFGDVGLQGAVGGTYLLEFRAAGGSARAQAIVPVRVTLGTSLPAPTNLQAYPSDGRAWLAFEDLPFDVANFEVRSDGGRWTPLDPPVTRSPVIIPDLPNGETARLELRAIQSETGRRSLVSTAIDVTPRSQGATTGRVVLTAPDPESVEVDVDPVSGLTTLTFLITVTPVGESTLNGVWLDCCDADEDGYGDVVVASIEPEGDAEGRIRRSRVGWYWQDANLAPGESRQLRVRLSFGGAE